MKRTAEAGYTLTELIVVASIVGLMAFLAAPRIVRIMTVAPEIEELERLRMAFVTARNMAVIGDRCSLVSVLSDKSLRVTVHDQCGPPLGNSISQQDFSFPSLKLHNFGGSPTLQFIPRGGTNLSTVAALKVETDSDRNFEIRVLPVLGNIRMVEIPKEIE